MGTTKTIYKIPSALKSFEHWADSTTNWEGQKVIIVKYEASEPDRSQLRSWLHYSGSSQTHSFIYTFIHQILFTHLLGHKHLAKHWENTWVQNRHSPEIFTPCLCSPAGTNLAIETTKVNKISSLSLKSFHFRGGEKGKHLNNMPSLEEPWKRCKGLDNSKSLTREWVRTGNIVSRVSLCVSINRHAMTLGCCKLTRIEGAHCAWLAWCPINGRRYYWCDTWKYLGNSWAW